VVEKGKMKIWINPVLRPRSWTGFSSSIADKPWKIHLIIANSFWLSVVLWFFVLTPFEARVYGHVFVGRPFWALIFSTAAILAGVYLFAKGLAIYREFRLLLVTPEAPIRSLAMGFVEVHGKAVGDQTIISPVSKTPCFYYKVFLSVQVGVGKDLPSDFMWWKGTPFYLQDATGKVRVNPASIEGDLMLNEEVGFSASGSALLAAEHSAPVSREIELAKYANELAAGRGTIIKGHFREYCILPGHWYDLAGTCVENPEPQDELDHNMIVKGSEESTFLMSWRSERGVKARLRSQATLGAYLGGGLILLGVAGCLVIFRLL
jgi:hypothetical protein